MDEDTAKLVISAGAAVGVIVWLVAMHLYRRMSETPSVESFEAAVPDKIPAEAMKAVVENAGRIAGQSRLTRPADNTLEITQAGVLSRIEAHRTGGQTVLTAELDDSQLRRKMQRVLAFFVVLLMPVAIVGVSASLWYFAASSPSPSIRWQSVQVLQMVHVLWPPFLPYGIWKTQRQTARDALSNLLVIAAA